MKNFLILISLIFLMTFSPSEAHEVHFSVKVDNKSSLPVNLYFQSLVYKLPPGKITDISTKLNSDRLPAYLMLSSSTEPHGFVRPGDIYKLIRVYDAPIKRQIVIYADGNILFKSNLSEKGMEYYESNIHQKSFWPFTDSVLNKNRNNIFSADLIYIYLCKQNISADSIQFYYKYLSTDLKTSSVGKSILNYITGKHYLQVGRLVNNFSLIDTNKNETTLYSVKSDYILLDFWFIHCGPCLASFPDILSLYESSDRKKFQVIGISIDKMKDFANWKNCIRSHALSWPNLIDTANTVSFNTFSITNYPTTVLLDKNYKIVKINPSLPELKKYHK